jgi:ribonuclease R
MGRKNSKKKNKEKHSSPHALKGVMDITRSGMGFVIIEGMDVDILIRPADFNTALHGDTVRVMVKDAGSKGKRLQGVIKEVLQRKRTEFIGRIKPLLFL